MTIGPSGTVVTLVTGALGATVTIGTIVTGTRGAASDVPLGIARVTARRGSGASGASDVSPMTRGTARSAMPGDAG